MLENRCLESIFSIRLYPLKTLPTQLATCFWGCLWHRQILLGSPETWGMIWAGCGSLAMLSAFRNWWWWDWTLHMMQSWDRAVVSLTASAWCFVPPLCRKEENTVAVYYFIDWRQDWNPDGVQKCVVKTMGNGEGCYRDFPSAACFHTFESKGHNLLIFLCLNK